jgi:hypothetical protein
MRKHLLTVFALLLIVLLSVSCSEKYEINNNTDTLKYYLDDLPIKQCTFHHEVKKDRYSGIGPCTYILYGYAVLEEEYCDEIFESFEWEPATEDDIFEKISKLNIEDLSLEPEHYYFSEDYNDKHNSNVAFQVWLDTDNSTILFYREFQDFD